MTEDTFVDFKCPYCGEVISFPREYTGHAQECPNCAECVVVPGAGSSVGLALPLPINTPRLQLRRFHGLDWKDLTEVLGDEELFRYLEGRPLGEEEITHWLEMDSQIKLTSPDQPFCLGIELLRSHKLIGHLTFRFTDSQRLQTQLTLVLNRQYHRQGFGAEAVKAVLGFCFQGIHLHRATTYCDRRNVAAARLFAKAGMRLEGVLLKDRFVNGEWVDTEWYARLSQELA